MRLIYCSALWRLQYVIHDDVVFFIKRIYLLKMQYIDDSNGLLFCIYCTTILFYRPQLHSPTNFLLFLFLKSMSTFILLIVSCCLAAFVIFCSINQMTMCVCFASVYGEICKVFNFLQQISKKKNNNNKIWTKFQWKL